MNTINILGLETEAMKELIKLFFAFFRIGAFTFGGGYAMLPMLEREIVVKNKWATMDEIMDYFAIGQCTPGIIAVNTATFIGYKQKKIPGGIVATLGVVCPSVIIISLIATILHGISDNPIVKHAFTGIGVAVCAILLQAIIKLAKSGVKDIFTLIVALCSLCLSLFLKLSPIIIVILAGIASVVYKWVINKNQKAEEEK